MGEGLALGNPVIGTNRRAEKSRDRVLTAPELSTIWHALQGDDYGVIIKLLMLTGQRAGEIGGLRWSEIDFEREVISLPGERTKNGRPHDIPMARTVLELLRARTRHGDRELVFGKRGGPYSDPKECWLAMRADVALAERGPWGSSNPDTIKRHVRKLRRKGPISDPLLKWVPRLYGKRPGPFR
jgi:integrase